jgi:uncharacterized protein (TIGR00290 family)
MSDDVVLSWSGGKDSALALWAMREELGTPPTALLTTITDDDGRVGTHEVPVELIRAQAAALGLPLVEVRVPRGPSNQVYEERLGAALTAPPLAGVGTVAFADLFLADIRAYREAQLAAIGRTCAFPLWGRDTTALARTFVDAGFAATLVCVDLARLDPSFAGRSFDRDLLRDLPAGVDPCGENGEFHTFVADGPIFSTPVPVEPDGDARRDGFAFHHLRPGGVGLA